MSVELTMLAYSAALLFVLANVQGLANVRALGLPAAAGNRDDLPAPAGWRARCLRTIDNLREGLAMFTPLVLIGAVADISNQWTVLGAQMFFYARLAHAALYLIGVPWVRTAIWLVGMAGTAMIFLALVGLIA